MKLVSQQPSFGYVPGREGFVSTPRSQLFFYGEQHQIQAPHLRAGVSPSSIMPTKFDTAEYYN